MTDMHPEFSRRLSVNRIGAAGTDQLVEADAAERAALAARLQLPAIASFTCRFRLEPPRRGQVGAEAELRAEVTQNCVVTLEPFEATIVERFALRFVPEGAEEGDIDPESLDELPYAGDAIDLGEAATEQLALALDPYPRKPGVTAEMAGDGSGEAARGQTAERPNPFAALARLRGKGPASEDGEP